MARDYYSVLVRAISALDPDTDEARRALYDRARLAIMDAGLASMETGSERSALEAAIDRIETEMPRAGGRSAPLRRREAEAAPAGTSEAEWVKEATQRRPKVSIRLIALLATAVLMIAVIGYAAWPRRNGPGGPAEAPIAELPVARSIDHSGDSSLSYIFRRQLVYYRTIHPVGTIVIAKSQRYLYLVLPNVTAVRYTIGVGRECANAVGLLFVSAKQESPESRPLVASATRAPGSPADFDARSLALGDTGLRIYGTNPPIRNGDAGCFALANEDIVDLYDRIATGARVVIG
jgi:hypothetical protein